MAAAAKKKSGKGLGRGLDALLGDSPSEAARAEKSRADAGPKRELPIEQLHANPDQPRRLFAKEAIEELAGSLKVRGMLQPILVRPKGENAYEIVAGERRWRAAQKAQLHKVPVIIRELTDEETAEIALIENIQRVDLNPVEEATAYQRLSEAFGRTQEEIAKSVGKSRSHVANIMRLLTLPELVIKALSSEAITMGHARAIINTDDPEATCALVMRDGLSVRQTEALAKSGGAKRVAGGKSVTAEKTEQKQASKDADTRALERDLSAILGLDVAISHSKKGSGEIAISYLTLDQLDDVCRRLMGAGV